MASTRSLQLPPALAARYEIVDELPPGGIGRVYRARQIRLNRIVVIKALRSELADSPDHVARFRKEALALARLDHENIVRIFDVEEHDGQCFIVMEYVPGGSLAQLLRAEGRLDPGRACRLAADVADALENAHVQGIVHRDLKPGNILLSTSGRARLADFGIARMLDTSASIARSELLGTPHYISPEQVRGERVTPASDLYSLGVVLFEMLTGRTPFSADTPYAMVLKHAQEAPPSLHSIVPGLPRPLCEIVDRTLAKRPAERFASAAELRVRLLQVAQAPAAAGALAPAIALPACTTCGTRLRGDFVTCPGCGRPAARVPEAASPAMSALPPAADARRALIGALRTLPDFLGLDARRLAARAAAHLAQARALPVHALHAASAVAALVLLVVAGFLMLRSGGGAAPARDTAAGAEIPGRLMPPGGGTPWQPVPRAGSGAVPGARSPNTAPAPGGDARIPTVVLPALGAPGVSAPAGQVRGALEALVARHQRALGARDLDALLADADARQRSEWQRTFPELFRAYVSLHSTIGALDISYDPARPDRAGLRMRQRLEGVTAGGRRVTISDQQRHWTVHRVDGRWLIREVQ